MAAHTLLCVEPDEATLATIRGALEPHGFRITNITNGEEAVAWGRQNVPALVIVSVEPRKVGYAICNKFKRSPELKDIPLILMSGEETPDQLEQHRKLKVRANEYLVKPFSHLDLLERVRMVFPLDSGESPFGISELSESQPDEDDDILLSSDVLEEISIGDSDIVGTGDGEEPAEMIIESGDFNNDLSTQAVSADALNIFDHATDAAFAALQSNAGPVASPGEAGVNAPWDVDPAGWDDEATSAANIREEEVDDALAKLGATEETRAGLSGKDLFASMEQPTRAISASALEEDGESGFDAAPADSSPTPPPPPPAPTVSLAAAEPDAETPGPVKVSNTFDDDDDVVELSASGALADAVEPPAGHDAEAVTRSKAEAEALQAEISRLEQLLAAAASENTKVSGELSAISQTHEATVAEKENLSREIEEIKSRPQSAASARDREILGLREVINKKERDLLDVRDQLDARERQILDHKDRIRENERSRRDLEDKNLGHEKALMDANERVEALTSDKQKGAERERVVKARLDDAHVEIQKAHDEVESLKKRGQATEEKLRGEMDRIRGELEGRILESEDAHRNELAHAAEERASFEAAQEQEHKETLARLRSVHASELENTIKKANDELVGLDERMQAEMARTRKDQDKAVASLKEEHALQLAAEREAHQGALEGKERDHRNEILGMRRRHEDESRTADERRQKELEEQDVRFKVEMDAAENRRRAELQARDEQHSAQVAEMDRRHFEEKTKASERHRSDMDEAHARAARAEGDLAARTEELSEAHRRNAGLEADLDATRADLRDRDVKLSQGNLRVAELETKTTQYEEQIMRSYQRLRSDDKVIEKAKRALAVALSLLEERGMVPSQTQGVQDTQSHEVSDLVGTDMSAQEVPVSDGEPS